VAAGLRFHSEPGLHPPAVHVTADPDLTSGDIFLAPEHGSQAGPMILNARGQLVWFDPVPYTGEFAAFNLELQQYRGRPVLTWWRGTVGAQSPEDVIMNTSYRQVAVVRAANGYTTGEHEFQITRQGTALISATRPVAANLSSLGGPSNGTVLDCVVQEIDIPTGHLLWQWHSYGHVPLSASYVRPAGSAQYDYFHLNSIQQLPDGNILISARNTWSVYEISRRTGRVLWTLGGKRSSFRIDHAARFAWQHDAHLSRGVLTLFDDAAGGGRQLASQSSGEALRIHRRRMTVSLLHRYRHSPPLLTKVEGSVQTLPNHDVFVGWGGQPEFSEYTASGRQIFNGSFRLGVNSYRAYRFPWHADPRTRPRLALATRPSGNLKLWTSWNGATQVAAWWVLGGASPSRLRRLAVHSWAGFETAIKLPDQPRYVAVRAVDSRGRILRTSPVQTVSPHLDALGPSAFVSSTGQGTLPVACLAPVACRVELHIRSGSAGLLTHPALQRIRPWRGALVTFQLSRAGLHQLHRAAHGRLPVRVTASDSTGLRAERELLLIPYSTRGSGPHRRLRESRTLQIVGSTLFVDPGGHGGILTACYAPVPCHVQATLSSHGTRIATSQPQEIGVNELRLVGFQLTPAGQAMRQRAPGNQLGATVALSSGGRSATGRVVLVGYR